MEDAEGWSRGFVLSVALFGDVGGGGWCLPPLLVAPAMVCVGGLLCDKKGGEARGSDIRNIVSWAPDAGARSCADKIRTRDAMPRPKLLSVCTHTYA